MSLRRAASMPTHDVKVLAKGKCRTSAASGITSRDDRSVLAARRRRPWRFFYRQTARACHPQSHLAGYQGLMQADAYGGLLGRSMRPSRKPGPIIEQGGLLGTRQARGNVDLARLQKSPILPFEIIKTHRRAFFAIEHKINGKPPEHRRAVRQERSALWWPSWKVTCVRLTPNSRPKAIPPRP